MYKVEKYLDKCISSIVNQTYTNLEIILVDDGSPDNCPAMCDDWARKDSRIKVIHKHNDGLANARNSGLDAATGEFIGTVDSDDYIAPNMYERLYALLSNNDADMSVCEFTRVEENGDISNIQSKHMKTEVVSREQMFAYWVEHNVTARHSSVSWNKLYRAEIFHGLRFAGGLHDDIGTTHRIIGKCGKIAISSERLYFYRNRSGSTTGKLSSSTFQYSSFKDLMVGYKNRYEYFSSIKSPALMDASLCGTIYNLKYALRNVNYFQFRDELKNVLHDTVRKILLSDTLRRKMRIIKLALIWLRSIFRPFIDKEKLQ